MDNNNLNAIIAKYIDRFDYSNGEDEEWYKWTAVYQFQTHWNIDAADFANMFCEATKRFDNLIDTNHSMPISGLKELSKIPEEAKFLRDAMKQLLEEDGGDLSARQARAEEFVDRVNERILAHWPGTHLYLQSIRSAILLLSMHRPADNYFLFWSRASEWAKRIEFGEDIGSGADFSLPAFYRMCDELLAEIERRKELRICAQKRLEAAKAELEKEVKHTVDFQISDHYHILVYDIIYCAYAYSLYADIPTYDDDSIKKRLERSKERKELDQIYFSLQAAEIALSEHESMALLPPELVGHSVRSKYYGLGVIRQQTADRIKVQFEKEEKEFVFPDVFIKKFLAPILLEDMGEIEDHASKEEKRQSLVSAVAVLRREYEAKKKTFDNKWKKEIHNEMTELEE